MAYFRQVEECFTARKRVFFDFSQVTEITPETIAFLVAHIKDLRFTRLVHYKGRNPNSQQCSEIFDESGFFDFVRSDVPKTTGKISGKLFHKITKHKVEPEIAKDICKVAIEFSLVDKAIYSPLYEILIECMANTNNHAGMDSPRIHNWWIFCYCEKTTGVSHFCFIDLGVGILRSLPVKRYRSLFNLPQVEDGIVFNDILAGKVKSRTGEPDRGKGIPLIYKHAQESHFRAFKVLTNRVFADLKADVIHMQSHSFNGTLLYWEFVDVPQEPPVPAEGGQYELWATNSQL